MPPDSFVPFFFKKKKKKKKRKEKKREEEEEGRKPAWLHQFQIEHIQTKDLAASTKVIES